MPAVAAPTPGIRRAPTSTAQLLDAVAAAEHPDVLIAVGTALHLFIDPVRTVAEVGLVPLHRATTVLTKQVLDLLGRPDPLPALLDLVADPDRVALPEGRTAAELCGAPWPIVRAIAVDRMEATLEGARTFGETAVLRLAATRAVGAAVPWWGTAGWVERLESSLPDRADLALLRKAPERAPDDVLARLLGAAEPAAGPLAVVR